MQLADAAAEPSLFLSRNQAGGARKRVAVMITMTSDGDGRYVDGAAMLAESIHRIQNRSGAYLYEMVAAVTPSVQRARPVLSALGYTVLEKEVPVKVEEIVGKLLRVSIVGSGCCWVDELIKLAGAVILPAHTKDHTRHQRTACRCSHSPSQHNAAQHKLTTNPRAPWHGRTACSLRADRLPPCASARRGLDGAQTFGNSLDDLFDQPNGNTFSLKMVYFIDYSNLKTVFKRKS
jgi:hypothetical protein